MQKEFDKVIMDKEEETSRLEDHNQKLVLQIKKAKDKAQYNQRLKEENQDLQKKLLENIEENNHLKKRKQYLIDNIKESGILNLDGEGDKHSSQPPNLQEVFRGRKLIISTFKKKFIIIMIIIILYNCIKYNY